MDDAVAAARRLRRSRATSCCCRRRCASFDWYASYAERGDDFARAVHDAARGGRCTTDQPRPDGAIGRAARTAIRAAGRVAAAGRRPAGDVRRRCSRRRRAQRDRPRDGALGVVGRGARRLRLVVVLLQAPGDVDGARASSRCSSRSRIDYHLLAPAGTPLGLLVGVALLVARARARRRHDGQRRPRWLGSGSSRSSRPSSPSSPCSSSSPTSSPAAPTDATTCRLTLRARRSSCSAARRAAHAAARPRHHDRARRRSCCRCSSSPGRRSLPLARPGRRRRRPRRGCPGHEHALPARAGCSRSSTRGTTTRTPGYQIIQSLVGVAVGRHHRRRARREPGQVGLPARRPHRLHLRHHRRGARARRRCLVVVGLFVALGVLGVAGGPLRARPLRHAPGRRRHRVVSSRPSSTSAPSIGLLPITGLPLPFVSFGGSSLVVDMAGAGLLLNVARQRQPAPAHAGRMTRTDVRVIAGGGTGRPRASRASPSPRRWSARPCPGDRSTSSAASAGSRRRSCPPPATRSTCCPGAASQRRLDAAPTSARCGRLFVATAVRTRDLVRRCASERRRRASVATRACRARWRRGCGASRSSWPSRTRARPANRLVGALRQGSRGVVRGHPAAARSRDRQPAPAGIGRRSRIESRRAHRARRRAARPACSGGSLGAPRINDATLRAASGVGRPRRPRDPPRRRSAQLDAVSGERRRSPPETGLRYRGRRLRGATCRRRWPPPTWSVCRRVGHVRRARRGRRAGGARALAGRGRGPPDRQRRAPRRRRRGRAGAATPSSTATALDARGRRVLARPARAREAMERRAPARRPGPTPPSGVADLVEEAPRAVAEPHGSTSASGPRRVARRRRRRRGHERRSRRVLAAMGHRSSGSDLETSPVARAAARRSASTSRVGHAAANVGRCRRRRRVDRDPDRPTPRSWRPGERGIPVLQPGRRSLPPSSRPRRTVAVAGTHGKTTTSSMLALVLVRGRAAARRSSSAARSTRSARGAVWDDGDLARGRGRRERRHVPRARRRRRDRHERRARPPRPLRGVRARCERAFERFVERADGPAVRLRRRSGAARLGARHRRVTYGHGRRRRLPHRRRRRPATGGARSRSRTTASRAVDGRRAGAGTAQRPQRRRRLALAHRARRAVRRRSPRRWRRFAGVARRFELRGEARRRDVRRRLRPPADRGRSRAGAAREGGWRRVVCVFQPHRYSRTADAVARLRRRVRRRRPARASPTSTRRARRPGPGVTGKLVVDAVLDAHPLAARGVAAAPGRPRRPYLGGRAARRATSASRSGAGDLTTLPDECARRCWRRRSISDARPRRRGRGASSATRRRARCPARRRSRPTGSAAPRPLLRRVDDDDDLARSSPTRWPTTGVAGARGRQGVEPARRRRRLRRASPSSSATASPTIDDRRHDGAGRGRGGPAGGGPPHRGRGAARASSGRSACPASVGGAVRMNAGGHGSDMAAVLAGSASSTCAAGRMAVVSARDLDLGYRRSSIGRRPGRGARRARARAAATSADGRGRDRRDRALASGEPARRPERGLGVHQPAGRLGRPAHRRPRAARACGVGTRGVSDQARQLHPGRRRRLGRRRPRAHADGAAVRVRDRHGVELEPEAAARGLRIDRDRSRSAPRAADGPAARGAASHRGAPRQEGRRRLRRCSSRSGAVAIARACCGLVTLQLARRRRSRRGRRRCAHDRRQTSVLRPRIGAGPADGLPRHRGPPRIASRRCRGSLPRRCAATCRAPSASTWSNACRVVATAGRRGRLAHARRRGPCARRRARAASGSHRDERASAAGGSGAGGGGAGARRDRRDLDAAGAAEGAASAQSSGPRTARSTFSSRLRAPSDSGHRPTSPRSTSRQSQCSTSCGPDATVGVLDVRAPEAPVLSPT